MDRTPEMEETTQKEQEIQPKPKKSETTVNTEIALENHQRQEHNK